MKMKLFKIAFAAALALAHCSMASAQFTKAGQSEISLGWGDQGFEMLAWHQKYNPQPSVPEGTILNYSDNYRYTQHWFVNYQYNIKDWLGVGGMVDVSGVLWDEVTRNGSVETSRSRNHNFYNIAVMPAVRFSYCNRKYVSLHSGIAAGLNINTGSEIDLKNRKTALAPAVYINAFGVKAGYKMVFASVDLGAMISLENTSYIYMLGSRMLSISVGVNF